MEHEILSSSVSETLPRKRGRKKGIKAAPTAPVRHSTRTPTPSAANLAHIANQPSRQCRQAPQVRVRKSRPDVSISLEELEKWRQDAIKVLLELTKPVEHKSKRRCSRVGSDYQCEIPYLRPLQKLKLRGEDMRPPEVDFVAETFQSPFTHSLCDRKAYRVSEHQTVVESKHNHESDIDRGVWERLIQAIPTTPQEFRWRKLETPHKDTYLELVSTDLREASPTSSKEVDLSLKVEEGLSNG